MMIPFLPSPDSNSITLYLCLWYARKAAVIRSTHARASNAQHSTGNQLWGAQKGGILQWEGVGRATKLLTYQ